jgi:hypothetical protein
MKKTLILGASTKPERYSYKAAQKLLKHGHPIKMISRKEDVLFDNPIKYENACTLVLLATNSY